MCHPYWVHRIQTKEVPGLIKMVEILILAKKQLMTERAKLEKFREKACEAIGTHGQGAREKYEQAVEEIENLDIKINEIDNLM